MRRGAAVPATTDRINYPAGRRQKTKRKGRAMALPDLVGGPGGVAPGPCRQLTASWADVAAVPASEVLSSSIGSSRSVSPSFQVVKSGTPVKVFVPRPFR